MKIENEMRAVTDKVWVYIILYKEWAANSQFPFKQYPNGSPPRSLKGAYKNQRHTATERKFS